jgi:hypothetical protein
MELIPNSRADETENVTGRGCHNDKSNSAVELNGLIT